MTSATDKARRLLPLYDDSVPIVCTIGDDEKAERIALLDRLRRTIRGIERSPHGLLLEFRRSDAVAADLRRFAVDEKRCCQFWGFAVIEDDDTLVLRWDGPDTAGPLLDTIEHVLRSHEPIESIEGLL
jgi:hypothetical protein